MKFVSALEMVQETLFPPVSFHADRTGEEVLKVDDELLRHLKLERLTRMVLFNVVLHLVHAGRGSGAVRTRVKPHCLRL